MSKKKKIKKVTMGSINRDPNPQWRNVPGSYNGSPLDTFDKAITTVNRDRGRNYGHPAVNFQRIADLKRVVDDCPDPRARVALNEIAVKMSRLVENPYHLDSWIDIAGYARTYVMVMQREGAYPDYPVDPALNDNTSDGD